MPQYRNPFEKGDLYIKFDVQFPENNWISPEKLSVSSFSSINLVSYLTECAESLCCTSWASFQCLNLDASKVLLTCFMGRALLGNTPWNMNAWKLYLRAVQMVHRRGQEENLSVAV